MSNHYTKEQIALLGVRPRERKMRPDGTYGLLPVERKEVKAVVKDILGRPDELWQFWRLIPFEEGYACQQRRLFEEWVAGEVENMWYDIGRPVFSDDENWSCPEGGWWPYLMTTFLDVSWIKVGNAIIDMDEIWTTLRNYLEEKVHGYRMCPGMMLYRVVREFLVKKVRLEKLKEEDGKRVGFGSYGLGDSAKKAIDDLDRLEKQMVDLVRLYPTETTEKAEDRVWVDFTEPKELWVLRQRHEHKEESAKKGTRR